MAVKLLFEFRCGTLPQYFSSLGTLFLISIVLKPFFFGSLRLRSAFSLNCRARMYFVLFLENSRLSCSGKRKALNVSDTPQRKSWKPCPCSTDS